VYKRQLFQELRDAGFPDPLQIESELEDFAFGVLATHFPNEGATELDIVRILLQSITAPELRFQLPGNSVVYSGSADGLDLRYGDDAHYLARQGVGLQSPYQLLANSPGYAQCEEFSFLLYSLFTTLDIDTSFIFDIEPFDEGHIYLQAATEQGTFRVDGTTPAIVPTRENKVPTSIGNAVSSFISTQAHVLSLQEGPSERVYRYSNLALAIDPFNIGALIAMGNFSFLAAVSQIGDAYNDDALTRGEQQEILENSMRLFEEAQGFFDQSYQVSPQLMAAERLAHIHYNLALSGENNRHHFQEAIRYFNQVIEHGSREEQIESYYFRGHSLEMLRRYQDALASYRYASARIRPDERSTRLARQIYRSIQRLESRLD
jgi:tetratricopeptide (TPR) repeat protein